MSFNLNVWHAVSLENWAPESQAQDTVKHTRIKGSELCIKGLIIVKK